MRAVEHDRGRIALWHLPLSHGIALSLAADDFVECSTAHLCANEHLGNNHASHPHQLFLVHRFI